MKTYIALLIVLIFIAGCSNKLFQPGSWFSKSELTPAAFSTPDKKAMFILGKADDLFFVLVLAAVGGLVFGIWARTAIGFYISAACAIGAVSLLLLAQFSTYIGYGLLAIVGAAIIIAATRWRQVADAAIDYADDLKKHVPETVLEKVNGATVQKRAVQKYIKKRRNGNGNSKKENNNVRDFCK